jgi:hypothetical protein
MAHRVRILHNPEQKTVRMHYASEYSFYAAFYPEICSSSILNKSHTSLRRFHPNQIATLIMLISTEMR